MISYTVVGCGSAAGAPEENSGNAGGGDTLTILAASSLTDAFGELSEVFEKENPDIEVRTNFAGSSVLLNQISHGAPGDVFASADQVKIETATRKGLVDGNPDVFAHNREVVIVPNRNPAGIEGFRDLPKTGVKLVLAQDGVPAAEYAKEILGKADDRYGGMFEEKVLSNLVSREPDVRVAVNRVALGEADATFGYSSDVTPDIRNRVRVLEVPDGLNVIAKYPIAILKDSENPELARRWTELVLSDEGQRVLQKWGFESVV